MSTFAGHVYHPINGSKEPIYQGWSWPAFFFGIFWCMVKGLWSVAGIVFVVVLVTLMIPVLGWLVAIGTWFYLGASGNELHQNSLMKKGYLTEEQFGSQASGLSGSGPARVVSGGDRTAHSNAGVLEDLERLQRLRDSGVLDEAEFAAQKQALLARR